MIYLDSSALMKLIRLEDETPALREGLDLHPEQPVVTSELGRVEVLRAARKVATPGRSQTACGPLARRLGSWWVQDAGSPTVVRWRSRLPR